MLGKQVNIDGWRDYYYNCIGEDCRKRRDGRHGFAGLWVAMAPKSRGNHNFPEIASSNCLFPLFLLFVVVLLSC